MEIILSVLVPTIHRRLRTFYPQIIEELHQQAEGLPVEILGFYDNRRRSVGAKRNGLLNLARGEYLVFVDDDDRIAPTYIADILQAIQDNPGIDVICFLNECRINNGPVILCSYSLTHKTRMHVGNTWTGPPAHTMVWKSVIAKNAAFPDKNYSEDANWVDSVVAHAVKEVRIDKVLYFYDFRTNISETRG